MLCNRKCISFPKQATEKALKGIGYVGRFSSYCCAVAENHICAELVLRVVGNKSKSSA